ncbi:uncharacterized protein LOC132635086 isoform X2 [Lycium barbarum]|uniref:uncharacterized protein LOC132635086 isoform X2 n=1 Tax=Lycium barbarum TaxID=112863 RepID=UPI00293EBC00|nr:uncharacterized protein LOC132635086 isoform X2 [Lycium barbarum]
MISASSEFRLITMIGHLKLVVTLSMPHPFIIYAKASFWTSVRLAPEEISAKLTGYEHNAVTCIGMRTDIPVILDEAITKLNPDFFWFGGGEIDLKLGIRTPEFIEFVKPFIVNCN